VSVGTISLSDVLELLRECLAPKSRLRRFFRLSLTFVDETDDDSVIGSDGVSDAAGTATPPTDSSSGMSV
jgi:hypothetical protein